MTGCRHHNPGCVGHACIGCRLDSQIENQKRTIATLRAALDAADRLIGAMDEPVHMVKKFDRALDSYREARAGRWTKEGWRSSMKVYVVEDEKYGTQAVFLKDEDAQKAMDSGKYNVSGLGCAVIEFELILPREEELRK